jgi:hypothetical protein
VIAGAWLVSDTSWKAFERRIAAALGTRRIPVTGERAGADLEDGLFVYQAKLGRRCPAYLREWLAGIRFAGAARSPGKVGVVVWKPKGGRDGDALVVLAFADWRDLHGSAVRLTADATVAAASVPKRSAGRSGLCARKGCTNPLPTGPRHGSPARFCSRQCRVLAWKITHRGPAFGVAA